MIEATDILNASVIGGDTYDCVVIGGGPAGLTAAIHLRRMGRGVRLVDSGASRAQRIARAFNVAGYPEGVVGGHLLERMRQHLRAADGHVTYDSVEEVRRCPDHKFLVRLKHGTMLARSVILCTGAADPAIDLSGIDAVVSAGLLRTQSWLEVEELAGKRVGVLDSPSGVSCSASLRAVCPKSRIIALDSTDSESNHHPPPACLDRLTGVARRVAMTRHKAVSVTYDDGRAYEFDLLLSAADELPRTSLAKGLAIRLGANGAIAIGPTGLTSADNVYAAGEVAGVPCQIDIAIGQAAAAAAAVHDTL